MSTFYIHEANLERLEKKLATIQSKCNKNQFNFKYEKVGEEFVETEAADGTKYTAKYIVVDVEGSVKYEGWRFIATIDHHKEGNIIRAFDTQLAIPDKYRTCGPECEHCKKIRSRKDTYLLYNDETQQFVQVGKNCMQEFTNGLDAETAAWLVSIYEKMDESYGYSGSSFNKYADVKDCLKFAFECYRHFGYEKSSRDDDEYDTSYRRTTRERVSDYMHIHYGNTRFYTREQIERLKDEMEEVNFNPESKYAVETSAAALEWIKNEAVLDNDYLRNLHIICSEDYTESRNFGMLVSLTTAYAHFIEKREYENKRAEMLKARREAEAISEYQGEVGQRLTFKCESFTLVTTIDSIYGTSWLYKITDTEGNIYTWFSSNHVDLDNGKVVQVTGTVKKHEEYRGAKQTNLTRCKLVQEEEPQETEEAPAGTFNLDEVFSVFEG